MIIFNDLGVEQHILPRCLEISVVCAQWKVGGTSEAATQNTVPREATVTTVQLVLTAAEVCVCVCVCSCARTRVPGAVDVFVSICMYVLVCRCVQVYVDVVPQAFFF